MTKRKGINFPLKDSNELVAALLDAVAERPIPRQALNRIAEIRQAVTAGTATTAMALTIIRLFPKGEVTQRRDS